MNHRTFGSTGSSASEVGLGCWQLGGSDWGDVSDATASNMPPLTRDAHERLRAVYAEKVKPHIRGPY